MKKIKLWVFLTLLLFSTIPSSFSDPNPLNPPLEPIDDTNILATNAALGSEDLKDLYTEGSSPPKEETPPASTEKSLNKGDAIKDALNQGKSSGSKNKNKGNEAKVSPTEVPKEEKAVEVQKNIDNNNSKDQGGSVTGENVENVLLETVGEKSSEEITSSTPSEEVEGIEEVKKEEESHTPDEAEPVDNLGDESISEEVDHEIIEEPEERDEPEEPEEPEIPDDFQDEVEEETFDDEPDPLELLEEPEKEEEKQDEKQVEPIKQPVEPPIIHQNTQQTGQQQQAVKPPTPDVKQGNSQQTTGQQGAGQQQTNQQQPVNKGGNQQQTNQQATQQNQQTAQQQANKQQQAGQQSTPQQTQNTQQQQPIKQQDHHNKQSGDPVMNEEEYIQFITSGGLDSYLDQYTKYTDLFFSHVERVAREAVMPVYRHIRSNPYLSIGFASLFVVVFILQFFKTLGSLCKKKPKFRYNKEETVSFSDINNSFKKFVGELESLKKQLDPASLKKGGAGAVGEATASNVNIPQNLQNELSYIIQNFSKTEESLSKIAKDKKQMDNFLFEFQKEVVESHKAIWNELYQLRKVFSSGKLQSSSSSLRVKHDVKDLDDTKSLKSNPESSEPRRRDESRGEALKKTPEPRSKSVVTPDTNALRNKPPVQATIPKERKIEKDKDIEPDQSLQRGIIPPILQNGSAGEGNTHHQTPPVQQHQKEEEAVEQLKVEKTIQGPFGRITSKDEEEEAHEEVQIPTNLADKAPSQNPFAAINQQQQQIGGGVINQNTGGAPPQTLNVNAKTIQFGAGIKHKPNIKKPEPRQPPIQGAFGGVQEPVVNSGTRLEGNPEIKGNLGSQSEQNIGEDGRSDEKAAALAGNDVEKVEEAKIEENNEGNEEDGAGEGNGGKGVIPPFKGGAGMGGPPGGMMRGKVPVPTNKTLPIPGVKRPGPPGANVFKGPPGNVPRTVPTQIKQPGQGVVQEGGAKSNSQV